MNRQLLEKPFDPNQIKQRQGNFGHILDYVEGHAVISRLNEAFEGNWTFEIVKFRILKDTNEVIVLCKLTAENVTKMGFGSKAMARTNDTKAIVSIGDDLKAAATDALKKAASLFGVGLYLYSDFRPNGKQEDKGKPSGNDSPAPDNGNPALARNQSETGTTNKGNGHNNTGNPTGSQEKNQPPSTGERNQPDEPGDNRGRLTNKQLAKIFAVGKSKGLQSKDIKDRALQTYKKNINFLNKEEASSYIQTLTAM